MKIIRTLLLSSVASLSLLNLAYADSITPGPVSLHLAVGETANRNKDVNISKVATGPVDVFFLTDTTGSMGGTINSVQANVNSIASAIAAVSSNTHFGVGEYKDQFDTFAYRLNQSVTGNLANVQAGVGQWGASGGGDTPEAGLNGLHQVATNASTGFRDGSQRLLFMIGDAPSHDPSLGVTEAQATSALQDANIKMFGINVGSEGLDETGQATRIADATGGKVLATGFDNDALIQAIKDAALGAVNNYSKVELIVQGLLPGLDVDILPLAYNGAFDRSIERLFGFGLSYTGISAGVYDFSIIAKVDGATVATQLQHVVVGDVGAVPEPSTMLLMGSGLIAASLIVRRRKHS